MYRIWGISMKKRENRGRKKKYKSYIKITLSSDASLYHQLRKLGIKPSMIFNKGAIDILNEIGSPPNEIVSKIMLKDYERIKASILTLDNAVKTKNKTPVESRMYI
jgi:hypothetical protein